MLYSSAPLLLFLTLALAIPRPLTPDPSGQGKIGNAAHQSTVGSQCTSSLDCGANGNTACCAFLPQANGAATIGICSGCGATTQQGKQGCGFGDAGRNVLADPQVCPASSFANGQAPAASPATGATPSGAAAAPAVAASSSAAPSAGAGAGQSKLPDPSLDAGKGNQQNKQFVTGACINAKDCGASQANLADVCCASVTNASGQVVGVCSGSAVGNAAPKTGCGFGDGKVNSAA